MNCSQVRELAPYYVSGVLSPSERRSFQRHLTTCADHRELIGRLTESSRLLVIPEAATPAPPAALRARIMAGVLADPGTGRTMALRRLIDRILRPSVPAAALALAVMAAVALLAWNFWPTGGKGDSLTLTLQGANGASAKLLYIESKETGLIAADGLATLPPGQSYQVWADTRTGLQSRGLLGSTGSGVVAGDVQAAGLVFITVEPASGSARPTGPTVLTNKP